MLLLPSMALQATAATSVFGQGGEQRTLYLHHTHTKKTGRFTFRRNGQYDPNVLRELNVFLADWRTHEPTKMDPALFDLLWTIYEDVGATQPINIVSSYRSPKTNKMLRSKSSGVAENSQHVKGKAMDIFIPGVPVATLRAAAMRYQVGGVGYYPTSGSPFVHVDTGSVRAWPRMTRAQLQKIFPDGRTLHVPADGKPLSREGWAYAEAEWKKCHMVPCKGKPSFAPPAGADEDVMVAGTPPIPKTPSPNLFSAIFGSDQPAAVPAAEPSQRVVPTVAINAPVPLSRPGAEPLPVVGTQMASLGGSAPIPKLKSEALRLATGPSLPYSTGETAVAALASLGSAPIPQPRVLMTPKDDESSTMVTAYVPAITPEPGAQRALQMLLDRQTTASIAPAPAPKPIQPQVQTASLGQQPAGGLDALTALLQGTWNAVSGLNQPPLQAALQARVTPANAAFDGRAVEFTAPDIDHVADTMVQPVAMSDMFFGEMYEPEGYLDKTTELGPLVTRVGFSPDPTIPMYDRFVVAPPQLTTIN